MNISKESTNFAAINIYLTLMKTTLNRWYRVTLILCFTLFLIMVYRREARMRTHIESLEGRIESLEQYIRGSREIASNLATIPETAIIESTPTRPKPTNAGKTVDTAPKAPSASTLKAETKEEAKTGKFKQVVRLELNTIDSETLMRIPGIGEGTARSILQYREKLGGFYSVDQLREKLTWDEALKHLDEWCTQWFWVDENLMQKIQINNLQFRELLKHPYLDYEEVKAIIKWRDRHKSVQKEADLRQLWPSDSAKLEKLLPYIEF